MNARFSQFSARLREFISTSLQRGPEPGPPGPGFGRLALELFSLQFEHNAAYRDFCSVRGVSATSVEHWSEIPAVPAVAFKELELSCVPSGERSRIFHSSGTTQHRPSRHFHNSESLALYEASLWPWFARHLGGTRQLSTLSLLCLSPGPDAAPHSSLVYMFETIRRRLAARASCFLGETGPDGAWLLEPTKTLGGLQSAAANNRPLLLLGAAFSFVHLLDGLKETALSLPAGSRIMETGGYKGRSRFVPKRELHALLQARLGVPASHIICEYGMSELSSQAYDARIPSGIPAGRSKAPPEASQRHFQFPPWARVRLISPETGQEVSEGQPGLVQVFDLANVYSVLAVQTEDLGIRRGAGFELLGRAAVSEPRGCSLMAESVSVE